MKPRPSGPLDGYRPQLDGLRALAVAAVAWSHWEQPYQFGIPFGAGVHLFYVLSGFLITGILLGVRDQPDRPAALRAFYARRALRIFPAFYLTLALAWWADVAALRETFVWHASYLSNVLIFVTGTWPGSLSHLWSLAVEEQFYVVWPWLIVFVPRRWLLPAVVAAVASAPVFRWWLAALGYRETLLAVLTPGSLDSLGMGALLALWLGSAHRPGAFTPSDARQKTGTVPGLPAASGRSPRLLAATAGTCLIALVAILIAEGERREVSIAIVAVKQTLQAVVFAWLVMRAAQGMGGAGGRLLACAPVVYIGRISYGLYLAHGLAGEILAAFGINSREVPEPWRLLILMALTVGVAAVSWHLLERPLNGLKGRFPYDGTTRPAVPVPDRYAMR